MWHLAKSVWASPEVTDVASQQESTSLTSIWNGVKNLFTQEEIAIELQEVRPPVLGAPPAPEIPRLLSANFDAEMNEEEIDPLN